LKKNIYNIGVSHTIRWFLMSYKVKPIDINASHVSVIMNAEDANGLGLSRTDRVKVMARDRSIVAILDSTRTIVEPGEVAIFKNTYDSLALKEGDQVKIFPTEKPKSVEYIKKKMMGDELSTKEINLIIKDISDNNLSDIELSAYVTAIMIRDMNMREVEDLTRAMVESGTRLDFDNKPIFDFHSVGGVPGNKITLIIVPIVAAAGLLIPKTSSRAISSACGTADILEAICRVDLSIEEIKSQTESIGGTIAWGGAVNIAPADDIIIHAEYPLGIDPYPQVLASVMAKKVAGGAKFLVMDIPIGEESKVRDKEYGRRYARDFIDLGHRFGIKVECAITYGDQPVGNAIGPTLEIKEALECLEGHDGPKSLLSKSLSLAGIILEMGSVALPGQGAQVAKRILDSGAALKKFREIIKAQGGDGEISSSKIMLGQFYEDILAPQDGYIHRIFNRRIVKIVRAAGSPFEKGAGLYLYGKQGDKIEKGKPIFRIYSDSQSKLNTAKAVALEYPPLDIEGMLLERIPNIHTI